MSWVLGVCLCLRPVWSFSGLEMLKYVLAHRTTASTRLTAQQSDPQNQQVTVQNQSPI